MHKTAGSSALRLFFKEACAVLYPMFVRRCTFGGMTGEMPDFPGCSPEGYTMDELMENVQPAALEWMREQGVTSLPVPSSPEEDETGCPPLFVEITLPSPFHAE